MLKKSLPICYFILVKNKGAGGLLEKIYNGLIADDRWMLIVEGLGNTLTIAVVAIIIGTLLGFILALMKISKSKILKFIATLYINIVRGIPLATQLLIFSFVIFAKIDIPLLLVAIIGFGINSSAYVAEILRAGIQGVDIGQMEAGRSLGLTKRQTMLKIIFPQAIKAILPTYTNEFVVLIKETSIAGFIAVRDLTKVSDMIRNATYEAWVPLFSVAIIYLILTLGLSALFGKLERRLARSDRS